MRPLIARQGGRVTPLTPVLRHQSSPMRACVDLTNDVDLTIKAPHARAAAC